MARKKKKGSGDGGDPAWLVTFTDMMTLMLTFFVLLVSMATFDERRKLVVLGSLIGAFGMGEQNIDARAVQKERKQAVEPGAFQNIPDMEPLRNLLWEDDAREDLNFESNRFVQILSINDKVLFKPGEVELTPEGKRLLDRILPILIEVDYPMLLGGHTSTMREEMVTKYKVDFDTTKPDDSWNMSLFRVLAVYNHLTSQGLDADKLKMEAFGRFRPKFNENYAENRKRNRRVDIVIDKRSRKAIDQMERNMEKSKAKSNEFRFQDFLFELDKVPGRDRTRNTEEQ